MKAWILFRNHVIAAEFVGKGLAELNPADDEVIFLVRTINAPSAFAEDTTEFFSSILHTMESEREVLIQQAIALAEKNVNIEVARQCSAAKPDESIRQIRGARSVPQIIHPNLTMQS